MGIAKLIGKFTREQTPENKLKKEINNINKEIKNFYKENVLSSEQREELQKLHKDYERSEKELVERKINKAKQIADEIAIRIDNEYAPKLFQNRFNYIKKELELIEIWQNK